MFKRNKTSDKNKRIVKYNTKKITIIGIVVVAVIVGTSLGIYYAVRPSGSLFSKGVTVTNAKTIRNKINNLEEDQVIGVYFHNTKEEIDLDLVYGTPEDADGSHDKSKLEGGYSIYTESDALVDWYSIHSSSGSELKQAAADMLLGTDDEADWAIDGFQTVGNNLGKITNDYDSSEIVSASMSMNDGDDGKHSLDITGSDVGASTFMWFKLSTDENGDDVVIWTIANGVEEDLDVNYASPFEGASAWVIRNDLVEPTKK